MDPFDYYLGKWLKNFAARQSPPADGRSRLIKTAAFGMVRGIENDPVSSRPITKKPTRDGIQNNLWSIAFDFSMIYSVKMGISGMRLIL